MNIVSVCACTVGIAHTYIAAEKIAQAAKRKGILFKLKLKEQSA